ncbi:uncharacterized protein KQ657_003816 [Scheffersomyces spartinae]|uniref:Periodic tryptophan protein 1 n=1 Tax=Scheffersomyces spartinae TaxID=45513 RepID=A0A9P7VCI6_9ASCO|nr:uncharacterized protein KQ657_003816 [Scheffersomyces spartinae]KAG7195290.1 hypothetical protein KQ657_003816 [Scheffersomyces spartinae]
MISSSTWVPRGYASEFPEKYELNDEEMERIEEMARLQLQDGGEEVEDEDEEDENEHVKASAVGKDEIEVDDDLKEYDLENYDAEEKDSEGEDVTMFPGLSNSEAKFHQDNDSDPYLTLPTESDAQEEKKELQIYPSDNLVLATRTEDDISFLDVYVYDDGAGAPQGAEEEEEDKLDDDVAKGFVREANLYVHHDIMLPAFPLCVEWINFKPGSEEETDNIGNFAAVGTFDPQIEIWDLDCMDKAFPDLILGEPDLNSFTALKKNNSKKKKKSKAKHVTTHHTDAILSLAHNKSHRNVLASTSADHTVKLWDLNNGTAVRSFSNIHNGKTVSSSQWHPQESQILLTGGYDSFVAITDVRISDEAQMTKRYKCSSNEEIENVKWGHKSVPELFYAGTDTGNIYCFDARVDNKPLWTLHAHDAGISSLEVNQEIPGLLSSSAMGEKVVKLWKCPTDNRTGPSMVLSRDFGVGNVLTTSFANDIEVGGHLTVGGVTGPLKMWDVFSNRSVRNSFKDELAEMQHRAKAEAKSQGKASRIARKYRSDHQDTVFSVESSGAPDADDSDADDTEE